MPTITLNPASGTDDGLQYFTYSSSVAPSASSYLGSTNGATSLLVGAGSAGARENVGFIRFSLAAIPAGAIINSASIQLYNNTTGRPGSGIVATVLSGNISWTSADIAITGTDGDTLASASLVQSAFNTWNLPAAAVQGRIGLSCVVRMMRASFATAGTNNGSFATYEAGANLPVLTVTYTEVKSAAGVTAPSGIVRRTISKPLAGVLLSSGGTTPGQGTLGMNTAKALGGVSVPSGIVRRSISKALTGVLFSGSTPDQGTLGRNTKTTLAGVLAPSGVKSVNRGLTLLATFGFGGALRRAMVASGRTAGSLSPAGTVSLRQQYAANGVLAPAGTLARNVFTGLGGVLSPVATLVRTLGHALSAIVAPSGGLSTMRGGAGSTFASTAAPSGSLARVVIKRGPGGSVGPSGSIAKKLLRTLAGVLSPLGNNPAPSFQFMFTATGGAVVGGAGTIKFGYIVAALGGAATNGAGGYQFGFAWEVTGGGLASGGAAAVVGPALGFQVPGFQIPGFQNAPFDFNVRGAGGAFAGGSAAYNFGYIVSLAGNVTPQGVVSSKQRLTKTLLATLSFGGALRRTIFARGLAAGSLSPAGSLSRLQQVIATGTLAPAGGGLARTIFTGLGGALSPVATAFQALVRALSGTLAPAGGLSTMRGGAGSTLASTAAPSGSLARAVMKRGPGGSVGPAGAIAKKLLRTLAGVLSPLGNNPAPSFQFMFTATGGAVVGGAGTIKFGYIVAALGGAATNGAGFYQFGFAWVATGGGLASGGAAAIVLPAIGFQVPGFQIPGFQHAPFNFNVRGAGGAFAGGSAAYSLSYITAGSGGAIAGGHTAWLLSAFIFTSTGGAITNGTALVAWLHPAAAVVGRGSRLRLSTDGASFVSVAQLKQLAFSGVTTTMVDVTDFDTPDTFTRQQAVQNSAGTVTFNGILNTADPGYNLLATQQAALALTWFSVSLSDGSFITFQGYISEYVPATVSYSTATLFSGKATISGTVLMTNADPGATFGGNPLHEYTLTGAVDGLNRIFTISQVPTPGVLVLYLWDGVIQTPPADYAIVGNVLTCTTAPSVGTIHRILF